MKRKIRVILITDGDRVAQRVVEEIAASLGLRCISASAGNPTPIGGSEIVRLLKQTPYDPVLVMFDDKGLPEKGQGELALEYVASHPDVEVIGAVAVASNTMDFEGAEVDVTISKEGVASEQTVNKRGESKPCVFDEKPVVRGDTVDVLNEFDIPIVVGVGDIGKMKRKDDIELGAPITRQAIEKILEHHAVRSVK